MKNWDDIQGIASYVSGLKTELNAMKKELKNKEYDLKYGGGGFPLDPYYNGGKMLKHQEEQAAQYRKDHPEITDRVRQLKEDIPVRERYIEELEERLRKASAKYFRK